MSEAAPAFGVFCGNTQTLTPPWLCFQIGSAYYAAHDACLLYANTQYFFEPSKYQAISTTLAEPVAPPSPGKASSKAKAAAKQTTDRDGLSKKYRPGFLWGQMSAWYKQTVRGSRCCDFRMHCCLCMHACNPRQLPLTAVLVWVVARQVRDPSASLSADRRGTVSLPDPESCFGKDVAGGRYTNKDRRAMISHIENMPSVMWPLQTIWSFKNPSKVAPTSIDQALLHLATSLPAASLAPVTCRPSVVHPDVIAVLTAPLYCLVWQIYGSPMLDVAIGNIRNDPQHKARFGDLLTEFKNTL